MSLPFDSDEFYSWRDHPITSHIFDVILANEITEAENYWFDRAFYKGRLDPAFRAECHARVKLANELIDLNYDDLVIADENRNG
jgi:hypothetical protein